MLLSLLKSIFMLKFSFEFENFNNRMLLLKEFNAKYFSSKETKNTR